VPYERQGGEMSVPVHVRVGAARTGGEEARKARLAVS
jgi:hypothetical protein